MQTLGCRDDPGLRPSGATPAQALDHWREIVCRGLIGIEVEPRKDSDFHGKFTMSPLGGAMLAQVKTSAIVAHRSEQMVANDQEPGFLVNLLVKGSGQSRQCGNEDTLADGDIFFQDTSMPYQLELTCPSLLVTLRAPRRLMLRYLTPSERMYGVTLAHGGMSPVAAATLFSIAQVAERLTPEEQEVALGNLLSLVASAAVALGSGAKTQSHLCYARIQGFIQAHLRDPDLRTGKIACAFNISVRQLNRIFEAEDETVSRTILRHRLERCRLDLTARPLASRTISEIAFSWGFNNLSHFSQSFCRAYGCSPRQARHAALSAATTPFRGPPPLPGRHAMRVSA